jgi:hypothetical protein
MIFKPASLAMETQGNSTAKTSRIVAYELTEEFKQFIDLDTFSDNGGSISPLTGLQLERAATNQIVDGLKGAGWFEFEGGADGIRYRQTKQTTTKTI